MKKLILIALTTLTFQGKSQSALSAEKICTQLDSISKADKIEVVGVFFHQTNKELFSSGIAESAQNFQFKGQFLIMTGPEHIVKYYNLNKLVHFTVLKHRNKLELYFAIY